jgi:hypothetical protein
VEVERPSSLLEEALFLDLVVQAEPIAVQEVMFAIVIVIAIAIAPGLGR